MLDAERTLQNNLMPRFNNIASWDRTLRLCLGIAMLVLGWLPTTAPWLVFLRVVALYPLITGLVGWCPLYALAKFDNRRPPPES